MELFDGSSLAGWHAVPRLPVPPWPGGPEPDRTTPEYQAAAATRGSWSVQDGAIVSTQDPPGCGYGGYLLTDESYADFRLTFEVRPDQAAPAAEFLQAWRFGDWNEMSVRRVGRYPVLTTWVNGLQLYELDTGALTHPNCDCEAVAGLLGRAGHIALEVHDNDPWMGRDRWAPEAVVRWRNIRLELLDETEP